MRQIAAQRLAGFGTTVFSEMTQLAIDHDAINLGQGFPGFPGPELVKEAAAAAIRADLNQYAPSHGLPRLRRAIAAGFARAYGHEVDPDAEVTVTSGATEAMQAALLGIVDPGDEVILIEPFYDAYPAQVIFAGGTPRYVALQPPGWSLDPAALAAAISPRTRAIVINTPHNPTGKVYRRDELETIATLCREHDLLALTDEVYDRIIYSDAEHVPLATLPGMWERTVTINSTGKTFGMTGWKIGYAIAAPELSRAIRGTHQFITFATSTPFQEAMAVAMEAAAESDYYAELVAMYTGLRDQLRSGLEGAGLPVLPMQGAFYLLADVSGFGFEDDTSFCRFLTTEVGVAAIPPSAFYADPATAPLLARFCFAKPAEVLATAAERLTALRSLRRERPSPR